MKNKPILSFLIIFFVANILQAIFTPILFDESYYWMFSQNLDWGYFDHPPMTALIVYLGGLLFEGTLGVRLLTTVLISLTIINVWLLIDKGYRQKKESALIFILLIASAPIYNIYGFVTTPDVPLLYFSSLFFLVYKHFEKNSSWANTILFGIVAALLCYSKYHAAIIAFFVFLSNPRLIRNGRIYISILIAAVLYLPHIYWQYENDFVTFQYHLVDRGAGRLIWRWVVEHLINTPIILNPLISPIFFVLLFYKNDLPKEDRYLLFIFWGFVIFFSISALNAHVEPHWFAVATIPFIVLMHRFILKRNKLIKTIKILAVISIVIIVAARIALLFPLPFTEKLYYTKAEMLEKKEFAKGDNVVFLNSYTEAAAYQFYTGDQSYSYNNLNYRRNQYDLWNLDDVFLDKPAMMYSQWKLSVFDRHHLSNGKEIAYTHVQKFPMINQLSIPEFNVQDTIVSGQTIPCSFTLINPYERDISLADSLLPYTIQVTLYHVKHPLTYDTLKCHLPDTLKADSEYELTGNFRIEYKPGTYNISLSIRPGIIPAILGTKLKGIEIVDQH